MALLAGDFSAVQKGAPIGAQAFLAWIGTTAIAQTPPKGKRSLATPREPSAQVVDRIGVAACIDVETTGGSWLTDKILEVAVVLFRYDKIGGDILGITEVHSSTQDPQMRINPAAARIHKITPQLVIGSSARWEIVQRLINEADFLVAHNAAFERRFLGKIPELKIDKEWRCSCTLPKWTTVHRQPSTSLAALAEHNGIRYTSHRAWSDVLATIALLTCKSPTTGRPFFADLLPTPDLFMKPMRQTAA